MSNFIEKEIWFQRDGLKIYSVCYIPEGDGPFPTIILCHGFCGYCLDCLRSAAKYAEAGFATCAFDFCGGSPAVRSDGKTTEMSIMTEMADLLAVFEELQKMDFVKKDSIYLWGKSQGGTVAALTAAKLKTGVKGLVLLSPALMIADLGRATAGSVENVTDTVLWDIPIGKCYLMDIWDLDTYGEIVKYEGPVFIYHGTADDIVPLSYSEKARDTYKNAELTIVEGGGHTFSQDMEKEVDLKIISQLK